MKFEGIMKVQIPMVASENAPLMGIAYDKSRKHFIEFDPAQVHGRMGRIFPYTHKQFFHCAVADDDVLTIGAKAPWQEW